LICAAAGQAVQAQSWPTRPIVLIFGFAPGGSGDFISRRFAEFASKELGTPVVVENRPGGGGIVASIGVTKAASDGYTIMIQANGPMVLRPIMDPSVGYDPVQGFSPIGLVAALQCDSWWIEILGAFARGSD